jgi:hypothetical protein
MDARSRAGGPRRRGRSCGAIPAKPRSCWSTASGTSPASASRCAERSRPASPEFACSSKARLRYAGAMARDARAALRTRDRIDHDRSHRSGRSGQCQRHAQPIAALRAPRAPRAARLRARDPAGSLAVARRVRQRNARRIITHLLPRTYPRRRSVRQPLARRDAARFTVAGRDAGAVEWRFIRRLCCTLRCRWICIGYTAASAPRQPLIDRGS